jgi:raffinose/stachyose/melibiose transport system permease protein
MSSFKTNAEILTNGIALPTSFSFNGYTEALRISPIPSFFLNSVIISGAAFIRIFFQIMMPVAKGGLTSAGVLSFLYCWNEFTFALILTSSQRVRTIPLSFSYFVSQFSKNYTAMFAAITIAVLPSIIVFAIFQEQVVNSLVAGAMKE